MILDNTNTVEDKMLTDAEVWAPEDPTMLIADVLTIAQSLDEQLTTALSRIESLEDELRDS